MEWSSIAMSWSKKVTMAWDFSLFRIFRIFTARKRSLGRLCFHRCLSVHRGGLCPGGVLCLGGVSVQGGLCLGESLSRGSLFGEVSVQGVSVRETPTYSYMRAVRILLECILVRQLIPHTQLIFQGIN